MSQSTEVTHSSITGTRSNFNVKCNKQPLCIVLFPSIEIPLVCRTKTIQEHFLYNFKRVLSIVKCILSYLVIINFSIESGAKDILDTKETLFFLTITDDLFLIGN